MKPKQHLSLLHSLDCAATWLIEGKRVKCEIVHHPQFIRDELSDWIGIPLLKKYHSRDSPTGLHYLSRRGFERTFKVSELDLLAVTIMFIQERNKCLSQA